MMGGFRVSREKRTIRATTTTTTEDDDHEHECECDITLTKRIQSNDIPFAC
jgi:hypothetical protein